MVYVCLLSIRNVAFAKLLAHITQFRAHFPDYLTRSIRLDNADGFTLKEFDECY